MRKRAFLVGTPPRSVPPKHGGLVFRQGKLPKWVKNGLRGAEMRLPHYPRKRTQVGHRGMSETCPISEVGTAQPLCPLPPVSDQKVDMATLAHAYATCAIAFFKVSALSSKARASSCDISGQSTSLTPARPTTLGSDRVTP